MQPNSVRRDKLTLSLRSAPVVGASSRPETILDTKALFKGGRELKIRHNSETYRLNITKLGKLILTK